MLNNHWKSCAEISLFVTNYSFVRKMPHIIPGWQLVKFIFSISLLAISARVNWILTALCAIMHHPSNHLSWNIQSLTRNCSFLRCLAISYMVCGSKISYPLITHSDMTSRYVADTVFYCMIQIHSMCQIRLPISPSRVFY